MDTKKLRCDHISCKKKINLIKFDCDCNKSFCIKHYNRHSHNCTAIIDNKNINILDIINFINLLEFFKCYFKILNTTFLINFNSFKVKPNPEGK